MERLFMERLSGWKNKKDRKPFVLEGARQAGKTWLVKEFGKRYFEKTAYISLQNNERMERLFTGDMSPQRLVPALSLESGVAIEPGTTLIVLDEVQEVPRALTALKYFCEDAPDYAVIATGSSLGIALHPGTSFPVGKVEVGRLFPLCFREFLMARGEQGLADVVEEMNLDMMTAFHDRIMEELKYYLVVGGMPEVVKAFVEAYPQVDFDAVTSLQTQIVEEYRSDFSKHEASAPRGLTLRLNQVWDSIPSQLAKENKKFIYGMIKQGGRGRDFELAIQWLVDTSLVLKVPRVKTPSYPLKMYEDISAFKLYLCDVGLLRAISDIEPAIILDGDAVFGAAKGAFAEQFACQELLAAGRSPYYWAAENATSELDFVVQLNGRVVPLEVKAGRNLKAKSLKASMSRFDFSQAYRFSTLPPKQDGAVCDLPLYAIGTFER
ncbi:ATP-binding protein [Gordonibacter massiliensis]|uniref:ATP-binding protein n=2 Tax=Gordonibacter massiliensis (ex Traore et al. 2017) TaxID=1841863 RepID=A0A842J896_9ACTN|nr:ATP-binding protein [Gordonibacter massiliensis (ex Traore et al. 2017)]